VSEARRLLAPGLAIGTVSLGPDAARHARVLRLDVGEDVVGGLDEVAALAASVGGLGVTVALEEGRGGLGGLLAGALEGIELIVVNAGGFVGQRHE
jgi:hypothetical protein